jgi:ferredoxin
MHMEITTDEDRCVGAGQCVLVAPDYFDQRDSDGVVVVLRDTVDENDERQVEEAANLCPGMAISLKSS